MSSPSSVPPGGLILVTGANSYVGSVAIQVFSRRGYRVRGTVRNAAAHAWMTGHFVPDISAVGAFDEAIKCVDGIAHLAMNMDMDLHNHAIIEDTIKTNIRLLEIAAKEPTVKSVVITSSLAACVLPRPGTPYTIDPTTWNTAAITKTSTPWNDEGDPRWDGILLYGASKARGEQTAFEWVRTHKPGFSFNTVVAGVNFGTSVSPENMGYRSTAAAIDAAVKGYAAAPSILPSQWFVNVEDTALLHLGALALEEGVHRERLLAFVGRYSWTLVLEILHRRFPGKVLLTTSMDEETVDVGSVDNKRSGSVLRRMGKTKTDGFTPLEDTLVKAVEAILENRAKNVPKTRIDLFYEAQARAAEKN